MKGLLKFAIVLLFLSIVTNPAFAKGPKQVSHGDKIKIITPQVIARLCPFPNCGQDQHITRIPEGTVFQVEGIMKTGSKEWPVTWFEVTFKGKKGWVSIYDTDKQ